MASRARATSISLLVSVAGLALWSGAAQAQFTSKLLNPSGASVSRAWTAYNGKQVGNAGGGSIQTAALWSGTPASAVALTNAGWGTSFALGVGPGQQVGTASGAATGFGFHAMLWTGTAASMVDLNPPGYDVSAAYATDGEFQAGQATAGGIIHAMLWSGTAFSAVDLHPAGFDTSHIYGAVGGRQIGLASVGSVDHAILWTATPESAIDLNGAFDSTEAYGMDANYQAGAAYSAASGNLSHAVIWAGSAESVVDLHPAFLTESWAEGVGAGIVCGSGSGPSTSGRTHAFAWVNGVAIDLHQFLPAGYLFSYAHGVDPITGQVVGEATNTLNRSLAFMWTPSAPPGFTQTSPVAGGFDVATNATFSWATSIGASSYAIVIATDPALVNVVASATGLSATQWTPPAGALQECSTYYWRVTATNIAGSTNATGSPSLFATHLHADVTHDGSVDLADFFEFLNCFDQSLPCADLTGDTEVDLADFFDFLGAFDQNGCAV